MNLQKKALRDAFLAEMWPTCHELPIGERLAKREDDRREQRRMEEAALEQADAPLRAV